MINANYAFWAVYHTTCQLTGYFVIRWLFKKVDEW